MRVLVIGILFVFSAQTAVFAQAPAKTSFCANLLRKAKKVALVGSVTLVGTIVAGVGAIAASRHSDHAESIKVGSPELKIAMVGDSLSTGCSLINPAVDCWNILTRKSGGPFLDFSPDPNSSKSLFEILAESRSISVVNYARPLALLPTGAYQQMKDGDRLPFYYSAIRSEGSFSDVSDQIDAIISSEEVPNLVMIWAGHNNLNLRVDIMSGFRSLTRGVSEWDRYVERKKLFSEGRLQKPEWVEGESDSIDWIYFDSYFIFRNDLNRLAAHLSAKNKRSAIVVFGALDAEAAAKAYLEAIEKHNNGEGFENFERGMSEFISLSTPDNRRALADQVLILNDQLQMNVDWMNANSKHSNVRFYFSTMKPGQSFDAASLAPDGVHLSPKGGSEIAVEMRAGIRKAEHYIDGTKPKTPGRR